jgi:guanylate kinase
VIQRRLRDAAADMKHWDEFDYVVVNDDFEQALADLLAVVEGHGAERARRQRAGLADLAASLTT